MSTMTLKLPTVPYTLLHALVVTCLRAATAGLDLWVAGVGGIVGTGCVGRLGGRRGDAVGIGRPICHTIVSTGARTGSGGCTAYVHRKIQITTEVCVGGGQGTSGASQSVQASRCKPRGTTKRHSQEAQPRGTATQTRSHPYNWSHSRTGAATVTASCQQGAAS